MPYEFAVIVLYDFAVVVAGSLAGGLALKVS